MYYFLAFLGSLFIAVMIAVNGRLASAYGLYWSTSIFFLVGLIFISLSAVVRREKLIFRKETPFYLYLGGAVGFFTTFFNFMAINKISVTAILALSLFGQAAFSLVIDQFGFFEMPVRKMNYGKFLGLIVTGVGIIVLLQGSDKLYLVPVIVSLLTGITVVVSRQLNSQVATHSGVFTATWVNYLAGLIMALAAMGIAGLFGENISFSYAPLPFWAYLSGVFGALIVFISNICVSKMSSFVMTLVMFSGQVLGGVAIDAAISGSFSPKALMGGIFALLGLVINVLIDKKQLVK